ncbi:ABC transporter permease [Mucilaginibacter sp. CSA2-8R]|uniref:ABC transporter permease n=1 Tax=Mucilaginibacter sp. CSA2-8R TaxID=3141542 RepID=UPI00315DEECE
MMQSSDKKWIIKSETSIFDVKFKEVAEYRDLLWLLVRRDFVSFYKQTILGPVWFFIQPLFTIVMYSLIFGGVAGISTDGIPQPLFYLAGIITWNYFSDCLIKTSTIFKDNALIFGKVYFPRLIMPLSLVFSNLVRFAVQIVLFVILMVFYYIKGSNISMNMYALLFPLLVVLMAILGLGFGMIISALTTKYRDLAFIVTFGVPLLMYATTVVYPLSATPTKFYWIVKLNPLTPIIEHFRYGFLGSGTISWPSLIYSAVCSIVVLLLGVLIFNKVEKNFIDTV